MRKLKWLIILALLLSVIWYVNSSETEDNAYSEQEFMVVSDFLLYQRRETEVTYNYCKDRGYAPDALVADFNRLNAEQITRSDNFIRSLNPMQRFSFRRELNRAFDEMRPQLLTQLEKAYDENKRAFALNNQKFTPQDFCRWLDENAASLLQKKTNLTL